MTIALRNHEQEQNPLLFAGILVDGSDTYLGFDILHDILQHWWSNRKHATLVFEKCRGHVRSYRKWNLDKRVLHQSQDTFRLARQQISCDLDRGP